LDRLPIEAKAAGVFMTRSSLPQTYNLNFHEPGRNPLSDPNEFIGYTLGSWGQEYFYEKGLSSEALRVPIDSRITASSIQI
jgi:hypothetical protein